MDEFPPFLTNLDFPPFFWHLFTFFTGLLKCFRSASFCQHKMRASLNKRAASTSSSSSWNLCAWTRKKSFSTLLLSLCEGKKVNSSNYMYGCDSWYKGALARSEIVGYLRKKKTRRKVHAKKRRNCKGSRRKAAKQEKAGEWTGTREEGANKFLDIFYYVRGGEHVLVRRDTYNIPLWG